MTLVAGQQWEWWGKGRREQRKKKKKGRSIDGATACVKMGGESFLPKAATIREKKQAEGGMVRRVWKWVVVVVVRGRRGERGRGEGESEKRKRKGR